jgi:hypothetical protein
VNFWERVAAAALGFSIWDLCKWAYLRYWPVPPCDCIECLRLAKEQEQKNSYDVIASIYGVSRMPNESDEGLAERVRRAAAIKQ